MTEPATSSHEPSVEVSPQTDFRSALGWIALGLAILIGALMMDRLERQGASPYTIPGLLPSLLGIAMTILGTVLALRSVRRGGLKPAAPAVLVGPPKRLWVPLFLCLGFGAVLVGHGLPFWLAAAIFVTVAIPILQQPHRLAAGEKLTARLLLKAAVIGLGAGGLITLVFQELFLVRLP